MKTIAVHAHSTRTKARFGQMIGLVLLLGGMLAGCTQEQQNKISRDIQNWTGTNGVLEIYAGDKVARRFLKIDKLSTAMGTDDKLPRAYRFGYGVLDENQGFHLIGTCLCHTIGKGATLRMSQHDARAHFID